MIPQIPPHPPASAELRAYGQELYERRAQAQTVALSEVRLGSQWRPLFKQCHDNVDCWVANHPKVAGGRQHEAVRGWLYFDMAGVLPYVKFVAHSVVRNDGGRLLDITPNLTGNTYPFIPANVLDETFFRFEDELIAQLGQGTIFHHK